MKLLTNTSKQPLLQLNSGKVINLNTLQEITPNETFPIKVGKILKISKHQNNQFLDKAQKIFSVSKVYKFYGTNCYKLKSNITLLCVVQGDTIQLIGNYPLHYIKLMYRYIVKSL